MAMYPEMTSATESLVGPVSPMSRNLGFKDDLADILTKYTSQGTPLFTTLGDIASNETRREAFLDECCESFAQCSALNTEDAVNDPYLGNYADRFRQYLDNSVMAMARESVMTGYAPIQSYAPFMLKRQWVSCVWKDVLQADVAKSNIIKLFLEQRWVIDGEGNRYQIPDVYYNKTLMQKLLDDSTGINLKNEELTLPLQNVCLIDSSVNAGRTEQITASTQLQDYEFYVEKLVIRDRPNTMTHDYTIYEVVFEDSEQKEHTIPVDIKPDLASYTLINGNNLKCTVFDDNGDIKEVLTDDIVGNVDFMTGTITVISTKGKIKKIRHRGKAAGRFNHRGLSVERSGKPLTFYMPESGPRLNAAITVEDAQDAIATANIDLYADNTDMMGDVLANLQDMQIKSFCMNSYETWSKLKNGPLGYDENFTGFGSFDATPNTLGVGITIDTWMDQAKEYFERYLEDLFFKVKSENMNATVVCHPKLVRYFRTGYKWIFSDQTDVSGVKLSHNIGVSTEHNMRIHFITSTYMDPDDGAYTIINSNTSEVITMKHVMHSAIIDRGYQNPLEPLVPNVMSTQRTLTFEVTPVQGFFKIFGRGSVAPSTHAGTFNVASTTAIGNTGGPLQVKTVTD